MINYLNGLMLPQGTDPNAIGQWLQQNGLPQTASGVDPTTGLPMPMAPTPVPGAATVPQVTSPVGQPGVVIDPKTGQPLARPTGPNAALGGWDGVSDKMRYLAQNARYNRLSSAAATAKPGQSTSGMGGGGGGFGHLLHTIFGHNAGPGTI